MTQPSADPDKSMLAMCFEHYNTRNNNRESYLGSFTQMHLYFGILVAATGASIWETEGEWLFLLIPFLIFVQLSIIQFNQYQAVLSELYLAELEKHIMRFVERTGGFSPRIEYFRFLERLFDKTVLRTAGLRWPLIKPAAILSASLLVVNWSLLIYSSYRGFAFLRTFPNGGALSAGFLLLIVGLAVVIHYNFIAIPTVWKTIMLSVLRTVSAQAGTERDKRATAST